MTDLLWEILTQTVYQRVIVGTAIIGGTCGAVGALTYLRRQALIADVIGHSSMLGVTIAFLVAVLMGLDGRNLIVMVSVTVVVGLASSLLSNFLEKNSPLGHDATMAVVLALTFGGGMALLAEINQRSFPSSKGGLKDYLFGNATTLTWFDVQVSAVCALLALLTIVLLWRDIELLLFDRIAALALGRPVGWVGFGLSAATVIAVVIGLKAVGLVLVVAYLILPAVAARQWVNRMPSMVVLSAGVGVIASLMGAFSSMLIGKMPTGPLTVIILTVIVLFSLLAAPQRSLVMRSIQRKRVRRDLLVQLAQGQGESR